ncbi:hypothetical protein NMG60_11024758 [Bertholletia excelsa]
MLLVKPHVKKEAILELVTRVGKHVFMRNGVVTEMKSFGTVQLGYGIKKLDGRYYQGQLMQLTMMSPPSMNEELRYLNKEDRLLRWLLVKNRNVKHGLDLLDEDEGKSELSKFRSSMLEDDDIDNDDHDEDNEYEVNQENQAE